MEKLWKGLLLFLCCILSTANIVPMVQDDTFYVEELGKDCHEGNFKLRCTAYGKRTYLHTTVYLHEGKILSCVSKEERTSRCYWGVYRDESECCTLQGETPLSGEGGKALCDCEGSWVANVLNSSDVSSSGRKKFLMEPLHQKNLCLTNFSSREFLTPCSMSERNQQWEFLLLKEKQFQILNGDKCLTEIGPYVRMIPCEKNLEGMKWTVQVEKNIFRMESSSGKCLSFGNESLENISLSVGGCGDDARQGVLVFDVEPLKEEEVVEEKRPTRTWPFVSLGFLGVALAIWRWRVPRVKNA